MNQFYKSFVPPEVGVKLKEYGYWDPHCDYTTYYGGPCYFRGIRFYKDGVVAPWEDIVPGPTYADVLDWLLDKEIMVYVEVECLISPTWTWNVQCFGDKLERLKEQDINGLVITEQQYESFQEAMNNAIIVALEKYVEK